MAAANSSARSTLVLPNSFIIAGTRDLPDPEDDVGDQIVEVDCGNLGRYRVRYTAKRDAHERLWYWASVGIDRIA